MTPSTLFTNTASRYHLFVSPACPFCHRVLVALALTQQSDHFSYSWVDDIKREKGWKIAADDDRYAGKHMREIYTALAPQETHRPAVPLLIDPDAQEILSTSSAEMVRFIGQGFGGRNTVPVALSPNGLTKEIDQLNAQIHKDINRAVYNVGSATEQLIYEKNVAQLFDALDDMEIRLGMSKFIFGDTITESDLFLFTTLLRFDPVYYLLFKCSAKRISDYKNLSRYLKRLINVPAIAETIKMDNIKTHYFKSLIHIGDGALNLNPSGIVPV